MERAAGPGDVVDPGFQRRGNAEIDHGDGDHHDVGRQEFVDQGVGLREPLALLLVEPIAGNEDAGDEILVDMRDRILGEVAHDHAGLRMHAAQLFENARGHPSGVGGAAARAAGEEKNAGHGLLLYTRAVGRLIGRPDFPRTGGSNGL